MEFQDNIEMIPDKFFSGYPALSRSLHGKSLRFPAVFRGKAMIDEQIGIAEGTAIHEV
jgi:hypothetical protein